LIDSDLSSFLPLIETRRKTLVISMANEDQICVLFFLKEGFGSVGLLFLFDFNHGSVR